HPRATTVPAIGSTRRIMHRNTPESLYPDEAMNQGAAPSTAATATHPTVAEDPALPAPSGLALTPLLLFLVLFFGAGMYFTAHGDAMGFYQLHAPVAILPALALAALVAWRRGIRPLETLLSGMGDPGVMLMCLIFLLAGGFVEVSRAIGAVDAIVA